MLIPAFAPLKPRITRSATVAEVSQPSPLPRMPRVAAYHAVPVRHPRLPPADPRGSAHRARHGSAHACRPLWSAHPHGPGVPAPSGYRIRSPANTWRTNAGKCGSQPVCRSGLRVRRRAPSVATPTRANGSVPVSPCAGQGRGRTRGIPIARPTRSTRSDTSGLSPICRAPPVRPCSIRYPSYTSRCGQQRSIHVTGTPAIHA